MGDLNPLRKRVEDSGSVASVNLSLKKTTSLYCHMKDVAKEKATCIEQFELA